MVIIAIRIRPSLNDFIEELVEIPRAVTRNMKVKLFQFHLDSFFILRGFFYILILSMVFTSS